MLSSASAPGLALQHGSSAGTGDLPLPNFHNKRWRREARAHGERNSGLRGDAVRLSGCVG